MITGCGQIIALVRAWQTILRNICVTVPMSFTASFYDAATTNKSFLVHLGVSTLIPVANALKLLQVCKYKSSYSYNKVCWRKIWSQ